MNNKTFIGFNEKSREDCINCFINNESKLGEIENEKLGIEILYSASKVMYNKIKGINKLIEIDLSKIKEGKYE